MKVLLHTKDRIITCQGRKCVCLYYYAEDDDYDDEDDEKENWVDWQGGQ